MKKRTEIYICELCGNTVEVIECADSTLICCSQDMPLQKENSTDAVREKHVPLLRSTARW